MLKILRSSPEDSASRKRSLKIFGFCHLRPLFLFIYFCHSVSKNALFGIETDVEKQPLWHWPPGTQSSAAKPTFRPGGTKSNDFIFYCTKLRNFKFCKIRTTQNNPSKKCASKATILTDFLLLHNSPKKSCFYY